MADGDCKYDVFISYSRRDYEKDGHPIPGNVISQIDKLFRDNGISHWIDLEGVYSGAEFMPIIVKAISESIMMVFVSSEASNQSRWTPGEVVEALKKDKTIVPFRIDDTEYNDRFRLALNSLNFIDYFKNPEAALSDLLRDVKRVKAAHLLKEQEKQEREEHQKKLKHIETEGKRFLVQEMRQRAIVQDIIQCHQQMGREEKVCPVCQCPLPLEEAYCLQCGWVFHPLEQLCEGEEFLDEGRLALSRSLWKPKQVPPQKPKPQPKTAREPSAQEETMPAAALTPGYAKLKLGRIVDACNVTPYAVFSINSISKLDLSRFLKMVNSQFGLSLTAREAKKCETIAELKELVLKKLFP